MTAADRPTPPMTGRSTPLIPALLAAAGGIVYVVIAMRSLGESVLPLDDGYIHLQFARNLAAGHGLSYEAGLPVPGSTAPLWTALLALVSYLPGSTLLWAQLLGGACFAGAVVAVGGLARDLGTGRALSWFAAALVATTGVLTWSSVSGLEIPLFTLLSVMGIRRHLVDRDATKGIAISLPLLAVAALARPEGVLLLGLAVVDRCVAHRSDAAVGWRSLWPGAALALLILAPVALFNLASSGTLLPTTFAAKGAGWHRWTPDLRYLHTVFGILFRAQPWMTWLAAAGVMALLVPGGSRRRGAALPAAWCVALPMAYSMVGSGGTPLVGNFGRYFYPLLPVVIVLGCLALRPAWESWIDASSPRWRYALAAVLALLLAVPSLGQWVAGAGRFTQSARNVRDGDIAAARWLDRRLPAGATIAVNDVGALKYLLPGHPVLDLAGIVTPELARYTRHALAAGRPRTDGVRAYLEQARPDYLVIFPEWFPMLIASDARFRPVEQFDVLDNITLGGNRVVVYETPWTQARLAP